MYVVYVYTNKVNGKKYIGMTSNVKKRAGYNGNGYKSSKKFYNEIQKYGWDSFEVTIIESGLSESSARLREIYHIAEQDTQNDNNGYNTDKGGTGGRIYNEHPRNMLGKKHKQSTKDRHSKLMSIKSMNPMTNGDVIWGETHEHPRGMLGQTHDDVTKNKIANTLISKNINCKAIRIIYPNGEDEIYRSIGETSKAICVSAPTIKKYLDTKQPYTIKVINQYTKKNQHLIGVRFEYIKDNTEVTQETKVA